MMNGRMIGRSAEAFVNILTQVSILDQLGLSPTDLK